jgi:hypothetical protein
VPPAPVRGEVGSAGRRLAIAFKSRLRSPDVRRGAWDEEEIDRKESDSDGDDQDDRNWLERPLDGRSQGPRRFERGRHRSVRQNVQIDSVFAKGFLVLCEALIEKPVPDVHRYLHTPLKDNRPAAARCKGIGIGAAGRVNGGEPAAPVNPTPSAKDRFLAPTARSQDRS